MKISYTMRLRKYFTSIFDAEGIESYYFRADKKAGFEYLTFELREIGSTLDSPNGRRFLLEINLWGRRNRDSLEILADKIMFILQSHTGNADGYFVSTYPAYDRLNIDEGGEINRIRLSFEVRYYTC